MCSLGAIASPISTKGGRAALLGGVAGTMLAKKGKAKASPAQPVPGQALADSYGQKFA